MKYTLKIMPMMIMTIIMAFSSYSWIMIWTSMEMNLLIFILLVNIKKNTLTSESSLKYFLIQSSASIIFLFSITLNTSYSNQEYNMIALAPPLAIMMKSGMAPLHSWIPDIVTNFNYSSLFIFLTIQKIIPMFILFSSWYNITIISAFCNIVIGSMGGISQSSLIKLLIFSSINNSGWMLFSLINSFQLFTLYFLVYTTINFFIIKFIYMFKIKWILQMKMMATPDSMSLFFFMSSFSGLPPLLGFAPKWILLKKMMVFPISSFMMIIFSLLTLFFYIKSCLIMLMTTLSEKKWVTSVNKIHFMYFSINFLGLPMWFFLA